MDVSSSDKTHEPPLESPRPRIPVLRDIGNDDDDGELSPWAPIVGPCFTVDGLSRVLGLRAAEILEAATNLRILSLHTADGNDLFPSFQIRDGRIYPELRSVLKVLRGGLDDPWTWAQWLNGRKCDGVTAMERVWKGNLVAVLRAARHDVWAWHA